MHLHIPSLLVILAAAVVAPLIGELTRRIGLSIVVLELALGVAIGPQGFGWAAADGVVPGVATIGMAFLFFLAGLEIELAAIRGKPLQLALAGWIVCLALSFAIAFAGRAFGLFDAWIVIGIALATTALGVLVPMLRDSGTLETPFGRLVMAIGVVGELGPILLMSLLLSRQHSAGEESLLALAFLVIVLLLAWSLLRGVAVPPFLNFLRRTMTQSSQLPVRVAMLLLGVLVVTAEDFGLDLALGALAAGMIVKLAVQGAPNDLLQQKLDAVGFGFLVPVFFITSGIKLDVAAVFASGPGLLRTAVLFVALIVVHLPLMFMSRRVGTIRESVALGLYSATTLSLIVAMTDVAVSNGVMQPQEAGSLVVAGVLSVVAFPMFASMVLGSGRPRQASTYHDHDSL
jgi:Kef-type K+ transport system membrane component KefB